MAERCGVAPLVSNLPADVCPLVFPRSSCRTLCDVRVISERKKDRREIERKKKRIVSRLPAVPKIAHGKINIEEKKTKGGGGGEKNERIKE
jgi:hypothetical protein